jgi:hypothetical protein
MILKKCLTSLYRNYKCQKSLEPMGILIIFLILIYRLKLKVKRLKMAFTLDERVEIVLNAVRCPHRTYSHSPWTGG